MYMDNINELKRLVLEIDEQESNEEECNSDLVIENLYKIKDIVSKIVLQEGILPSYIGSEGHPIKSPIPTPQGYTKIRVATYAKMKGDYYV